MLALVVYTAHGFDACVAIPPAWGLIFDSFAVWCLAIPRFDERNRFPRSSYIYVLAGIGNPTAKERSHRRPMETNFKNVYIGKLIEEKVKVRHLTYAEFARMIHVARTSLYHIFNSKNIDVERLLLISKVLDYDFISEVYMKDERNAYMDGCSGAHIVLPLRDKDIDLSELPPELIRLIREKVNRLHDWDGEAEEVGE